MASADFWRNTIFVILWFMTKKKYLCGTLHEISGLKLTTSPDKNKTPDKNKILRGRETVQLNWNIKAKQDEIDYLESLKLIYRNIFSTVSSVMNFNNFVWSIAGQNRLFFSSSVTPSLPTSYFPSNVRFDAFHEGRNKCYKHRFPSDSHTQIYTIQCWRRLRTLSCIQEKDVILITCPSPTGPHSAINTLTRRTINQISMKWVDLN